MLEEFFRTLTVVDGGPELIRVGGEGDGGYLVPDDMDGTVACFSPGVAGIASFEEALLARGIPCFLVDGSVSSAPLTAPGIHFERLFLGPTSRPGWITLDEWISAGPAEGDLILQMDIEGWEWPVLAAASTELLRRFRIMVIEFHDLHLLALGHGLRTMGEVVRRLNEDFALVHVHPNNYEYPVTYRGYRLHPVVETTWLRRDRVSSCKPVAALGHVLDRANDPALPDAALDPRWG